MKTVATVGLTGFEGHMGAIRHTVMPMPPRSSKPTGFTIFKLLSRVWKRKLDMVAHAYNPSNQDQGRAAMSSRLQSEFLGYRGAPCLNNKACQRKEDDTRGMWWVQSLMGESGTTPDPAEATGLTLVFVCFAYSQGSTSCHVRHQTVSILRWGSPLLPLLT